MDGISGIYPNPVKDSLDIDIEAAVGTDYVYEIYDLGGHKIVGAKYDVIIPIRDGRL